MSGAVNKYVENYLESSGLQVEQKVILIDYNKFFEEALAGNDAVAESISSRYGDIHTAALHALAGASDKSRNPYALIIAAFIWSIHNDDESVCTTLGNIAELLENSSDIAMSHNPYLCTLWVLLSGIHNYGRP
jgi:hypothetical protein